MIDPRLLAMQALGLGGTVSPAPPQNPLEALRAWALAQPTMQVAAANSNPGNPNTLDEFQALLGMLQGADKVRLDTVRRVPLGGVRNDNTRKDK